MSVFICLILIVSVVRKGKNTYFSLQFHIIDYFCRINSKINMQVQPDISTPNSTIAPAIDDEIVGMPDDCVSIDSFFSVLRQAVKEHYDNL